MTTKKIDDYKIFLTIILGDGAQGTVYAGINRTTKQEVAIKVIDKTKIKNEKFQQAIFNEMKYLGKVKSPYVVKFKKALSTKNNYYLVTQRCQKDLRKLLHQKLNQTISEQNAISMMKDISTGVLDLIKEGIVHRDLKPANILYLKGKLKIGDLGFSKQIEKLNDYLGTEGIGTLHYMSPQILEGQNYTVKASIWSLGIILYQILHKKTPWQSSNEQDLSRKIKAQKIHFRPDLSKTIKQFIQKCLEIKQSDRLGIQQYYSHEIFGGHFKEFKDGNCKVIIMAKYNFIMRRLLSKIISENLDIQLIGKKLGHFDRNIKFKFQEFFELLRNIEESIEIGQARYIFSMADQKNTNQILLNHFQRMLDQFELISSHDQDCESQPDLSNKSIAEKVQICFRKIKRDLEKNRMTLYQLFCNYDKQGSIFYSDFERMIFSLGKNDFTEQELKQVFEQIDIDHSESIEFSELNAYFSNILGIPPQINGPNLKADTELKLKNWCKKLQKYLQDNHTTLYQVFEKFDMFGLGSMTYEGFQKLIKQLNIAFSQEQLKTVFQYIDIDHSKSIQFHELNIFFSRMIGIPQNLNLSKQQKVKFQNRVLRRFSFQNYPEQKISESIPINKNGQQNPEEQKQLNKLNKSQKRSENKPQNLKRP